MYAEVFVTFDLSEKFDTDLKTLQPPEEKHFLNPRLSISTRFLSRFQDRVRGWPSRAPPSVSIPARISEESNVSSTSVISEPSSDVASTESTRENNSGAKSNRSVLRRRASCMISQQSLHRTRRRRHTVVVVQCRESLRDVTSRTHNSSVASSVQQGAPRLGYLGTTASSRAKLSQEENLPSSSDLQPPAHLLSAGLDLLGTKPDPQKDQTSSVALSSQTSQHHVPAASPQVVVTPTETRRWSISSVEETPTNQNQTLILSPTPSITPTATPTACDIIPPDIITCPASRQVEGPGGSETRTQTDPGSGDVEESVSLQQCQQVANELRQTARRAVHLYQQLGVSERRLQMSSVLQEAFDFVNDELQAVLRGGDGRGSGAPCGRLEDDGTRLLLEKYSDQLVQMTQNKLDRMCPSRLLPW
ncbi:hypothetical protein L3Q82_018513 [Scortum barcoo]|uniref:Uncharacterized protein n=1 Tax=Scortum barcoo TaxID=214431 RepID=A0ACB8VGE2_9TELE|nr:hypothetical protein L3Q82_018513 [Scortum barcoo]